MRPWLRLRGQDLYGAGYALGNEAVKRFGLRWATGPWSGASLDADRGERTKGAMDALEKAGLTVDYIEIDSATNKDPAAGAPTFVAYVSAHPDVKLVITDHGAVDCHGRNLPTTAGKKPAISTSSASTSPRPPSPPSRAAGPDW